MPALSTLSVCEHTLGYNTFNSEDLALTPISPPSWFTFNLVGIDPGPPEVATYEYTVANDAPIGVYEIQFGGDFYITITVEDCAIEVAVCLLTVGSVTPDPPEGFETWGEYLNGSSTQISFFDQVIYYTFTEEGTFWISLLADGRTPQQGPYVVYKFVVTNCFVDACEPADSDYLLRIVWLNPTGGWSSYLFNQKKTYGVDIGGSRVFKNSDRETLYIQHDNIFDSVVQPSGMIPESHVDFLKSLKYSIAAFVYDGASGDDITYLPIFNYAKSFELKKQSNGFYKYDFEFSYSAEIITQTR